MRTRVLVSGHRFDAHYQSNARQHIGMMDVARPAGFFWIIADDGAFLVTVKRFHGRIDIENIALAQQRFDAMIDMTLQPFQAFGFRN